MACRENRREIEYGLEELESLGVIPFTLRKDSISDEYVVTWNTIKEYYPEHMRNTDLVTKILVENTHKAGIGEIIMPDQPAEPIEVCHELTYKEILQHYRGRLAHTQGTIWNEIQNYDALFMTRETHCDVLDSTGRSIALVFPAADCAVIRMYDPKKDVIGITHSGVEHTTKNVIGSMSKYFQEHFNSNLNDVIVFVAAFASGGMVWDRVPPYAIEHPEEWQDYVVKIEEGKYLVKYGEKIYDQLIESGLSKDNVYFDSDDTIQNNSYFSNTRFKRKEDNAGRNMFGISFDSLPIYEKNEGIKMNIRLK